MTTQLYVAYFDNELPQTRSEVEPQVGSVSTVANPRIASVANIAGCINVTELENKVITSTVATPVAPIIVTFLEPDPISIVVTKAQTITVVEEDDIKLYEAEEILTAYTAVSEYDGRIVASNPMDISDYNKYIGILLEDLQVGEFGKVKIAGTIERPEWNWDTTKEVFIGIDGALVQTPPAGNAYTQEIASALVPQCLKVERGLAIRS